MERVGESKPRVFPLSVWRARHFTRNLVSTNHLDTELHATIRDWASGKGLHRKYLVLVLVAQSLSLH